MASPKSRGASPTQRRRFLIASGALVFAPFASAQQAAATQRVLGILSANPAPTPQELAASPIQSALRKLGWVEGRNLRVERAFADGREERLPVLAAELVRKRVDVIWTNGPGGAVAAARATGTVPIVAYLSGDPVNMGLVDSLARPGRNVTGIAYVESGVPMKQLEVIKEMLPRMRRLAVIWVPSASATVAGTAMSMDPIDAAAKKLGFVIERFPVDQPKDFDAAFRNIMTWRAQAFRVINLPAMFRERTRILDFAVRNRLPGMYGGTPWIEAGGLVSYGPSFDGLLERSINMVDRIFRGAKPADIPVEQPTRYELAVNLKTARALKLKIPQSVLARADRVID